MVRTKVGVWAKGAAFFRRYRKRLWSALGLVLASLLGGPLGQVLSAVEHVRTVNDALTWVHDKLDPATKLLAPAVALIPPWFVANWFAIGCFTLATLLVLAVVIQYFLDERALRQSGVAVGAADSDHVIAPEPELTPPEPLRPLSNAWDSAPGVPEAHAAKLSERLFHFVARRNDDHPLGILAPTMQGRGHFAEVNPASFLATPEGLARGKRYDANTLALYNTRYADDVRAKRFAIINFQMPPDPTKDAIILEGPTCVSDIKLIARYLHELVIARDASAGAHDTASSAPASVPEHSALSVTSAMGREKRPDRAYFAAHLDTGNMWLKDATNPEPFGGPPSHTLADQAYGTWTVHNDAARPALNVHLLFAYQWQRMGHTETLLLDQTVGITIPRIDGMSRIVIRIGNFTSEYILHISPAANCAFEAPGDTSQRPCILQGANPARRENRLSLFPGAQKDHAREPSAITESVPAQSDTATATFRNVRTGETHSVSSLGIASDQEQTEYLLNLINLYAQSRNTERGWLSTLLDPATRIGAPFPSRDKQYDYPRAIKLLGERGLVRILNTRKREYVDMIGLSIHEDFEFERLNRLVKNATIPPATTTKERRAKQPPLVALARQMRAFVASHERRSPPPPRPRPVYDPEDQDYDDMERLASNLGHSFSEDAYRTHWGRMGFFFWERFAPRIADVSPIVAPTTGDDPRLEIFRGKFNISNCNSETVLYIAAHLEKVAADLDKAK